MLIFYKEVALQEGFVLSELPKNHRIVGGREVSLCSGFELFNSLKHQQIKCYKCKCVADRWISTRGRYDVSSPVLNLYATFTPKATKKTPNPIPRVVMMTRDHIIPKSLGGVDSIENLRPACEICNGKRGTKMNKADTKFMVENPHLIDEQRRLKGQENAKKVGNAQAQMHVREKLRKQLGFKNNKQMLDHAVKCLQFLQMHMDETGHITINDFSIKIKK
jgi:5-methylcytosine-specific restriction endonuclease McrA